MKNENDKINVKDENENWQETWILNMKHEKQEWKMKTDHKKMKMDMKQENESET